MTRSEVPGVVGFSFTQPRAFAADEREHLVALAGQCALAVERARLYERELAIREQAANAENATKTDIGWGHQIRSYVLQPYQLVKDLRTGVESTAPSDVLDGELNEFMEAALAHRISGKPDLGADAE